MPTQVTVLDGNTGLSSLRFSVDAAEMVANDPGRYSITDRTQEVAAKTARGTAIQANRIVKKAGAAAIVHDFGDWY